MTKTTGGSRFTHRQAARATAAAAAAAGMLALGTGSAAASSNWSAPLPLRGSGGLDQSISFGPAGSPRAIFWDGGTPGVVDVAAGTPDGRAFSRPKVLIALPRGSFFGAASETAAGAAVVTYERKGVAPATHRRYDHADIVVAPPGGAFTPSVNIAGPAVTSGVPVLGLAPTGAAIVATDVRRGDGWHVVVALRAPGRSFAAPILLPRAAGDQVGGPAVAVDPAGHVVVAWQQGGTDHSGGPGDGHVEAATGAVTTGLGAPQTLAAVGDYADIAAAIGGGGRAIVGWDAAQFSPGNATPSCAAAIAAPGAPFAAPTQLSPACDGDLGVPDPPAVAVTGDGTALAALSDNPAAPSYSPDAAPIANTIETFSAAPGATGLTGPSEAAHGNELGFVALAPGAGATAVVTFIDDIGGTGAGGAWRDLEAAVSSGGGAFGPPDELSAIHRDALFPTPAVGPTGTQLVAWIDSPSGGDGGAILIARRSP